MREIVLQKSNLLRVLLNYNDIAQSVNLPKHLVALASSNDYHSVPRFGKSGHGAQPLRPCNAERTSISFAIFNLRNFGIKIATHGKPKTNNDYWFLIFLIKNVHISRLKTNNDYWFLDL